MYLGLIIALYVDKTKGIITPCYIYSKIILNLYIFIIIFIFLVYQFQKIFGLFIIKQSYWRIFWIINFGDIGTNIFNQIILIISAMLIGIPFLLWYHSENYYKIQMQAEERTGAVGRLK